MMKKLTLWIAGLLLVVLRFTHSVIGSAFL